MSLPDHSGPETGSATPEDWISPEARELGEKRRSLTKLALSDLGNALRLQERFGELFRHNGALGWLHWDGRLWRPDDTDAQVNLAVQRLPDIIMNEAREAHLLLLDSAGKDLLKHSQRTQSATALGSALRLWRPHVFEAATAFDQHSRLVTVENVVLDLETKQVRDFDPALLCTRMMPVTYDPDAEAPFFTGTLEYFVPDRQVREYLQRLFGYCLTSEIGEQQFAVMVGPGANGKSTLLEAIRQVLGKGSERGFSAEVNPKVFESRSIGSGNQADPERFGMLGMRMVTPIETDTALRLDAPFIKSVTGGEAMTARDLYRTSVTWKPSFKILFASNHEPRIDDDSEGMWRRVHKVTFDVRIPEEHKLPWEVTVAALRAERAGVLNWMLEGFDEWCRHGLAAPPQVALASAMMRADQDLLGLFLRECTVVDAGSTILRGDLWKLFGEWRRGDASLIKIGRTEFYSRMVKRLGEPDSRGHFRGLGTTTTIPY